MSKTTVFAAGLLLWASSALSQTTTQLSPQAAYEEAVRPVEIVHRSVTNWSEAEMGSLAVAMANAARGCGERKPESFAGDDLIALARLCSLGQMWEPMRAAALRYIELPHPRSRSSHLPMGCN